jgi:hypothetical protein
MKNINLILLLVIFNLSLNAQDKELEYPFAAPGSQPTRGVFGNDDRREVKDAYGYKDFVRATAVMISKEKIYEKEFYAWSLRDLLMKQFGTDKFDKNVKFLDQPTLSSCTGFLIAPGIMVTAGHCVNSMEAANKYVWVFDYTNEEKFIDGNRLRIKPENIFEVEQIIASTFNNNTKDDYAILRLNTTSDRAPYRFRTSGNVLLNGEINTIGSPTGLPLKFSTNAVVVDNSPINWFKSDIDSFPGNSGGPVFDKNGFIEGILVRGAVEFSDADGRYTGDYKYDRECDCIKTVQWDRVNYTAGCQAHKITALPSFALIMSIYENLEYAIKNKLEDRFKSWSIYNWAFNHPYTKQRGRFEKLAISYNNMSALKVILEATAKDFSDEYSRELIDMTISKNDVKALEVILNTGILPDAGMNSNYTVLQEAVLSGNVNIAEILINFGANTKVKTSNNDNLLHLAAKNGNYEIAKMLVENGVVADVKNNDRKYPDKLAKKAKYKDLAKYLKKARKGRL